MKNNGKNLKRIREERGITVNQLAETAGISPQIIQAWEFGRREPSGEAVRKIAEALKVTPEELNESAEETEQRFEKAVKEAERKKCCDNCEMNMGVCGYHYKPVEELKKEYPNGCPEWELSFMHFQNAVTENTEPKK